MLGRLRQPGVLRIVHRDARRNVLTIEPAGISRFWTRYNTLTCESVRGMPAGALIELMRD